MNLNSIKHPYISLPDPDQIIKSYPKSTNSLREFLFRKFQESLPPGSVLPISTSTDIPDNFIETVLYADPRKLYDFFDENNILIAIQPENGGLKFSVYQGKTIISDGVEPNRIEAEIRAFLESFLILENQLP